MDLVRCLGLGLSKIQNGGSKLVETPFSELLNGRIGSEIGSKDSDRDHDQKNSQREGMSLSSGIATITGIRVAAAGIEEIEKIEKTSFVSLLNLPHIVERRKGRWWGKPGQDSHL